MDYGLGFGDLVGGLGRKVEGLGVRVSGLGFWIIMVSRQFGLGANNIPRYTDEGLRGLEVLRGFREAVC